MTNHRDILDVSSEDMEPVGEVAERAEKAGQSLAKREAQDNVPAERREMSAMEMVGRALEMGVSAEILQQMMDLRDREEASRARKAFNEAFSAFKAEAIMVSRNRRVTDGPLKGRSYAELVSFVEAATPALSKHGLSASWDITRDEKDWIEVTCTIEHVLGGSKKVALGGPPDTGGAKNPLQARISTVTYLERATFKAACGLAEQGDDDDGRCAGKADNGPISEEQAATIRKLADEVGADLAKLCDYFKVNAVPDLPASQYQRAIAALEKKRKASADG